MSQNENVFTFDKSKSSRDRTLRPSPWRDALLVLVGCLLCAFGFNALIKPNALAPGGLPGLAVLLAHFTPVAPAVFIAAVNAVLLLIAWTFVGKAFALRSLLGSILLPVAIYVTQGMAPLVREPLLAALVGGAITGVGIGLVFRGKSTVGGFTTLAVMLQRRRGVAIDRSLLFFDALILVSALAFMPAEASLSAIVCSFVLAKTARATLTGISTSQLAWVVSDKSEELRKNILGDVDLGLTVIPARGGYSDREKDLLMVVMRPSDVPRFKAAVKSIDPAAFVVFAETSEVLGYGFAPHH